MLHLVGCNLELYCDAVTYDYKRNIVTCFVVDCTYYVNCSVHNTIVILLKLSDVAIPHPHCIVGLASHGLKCGLKYRKMSEILDLHSWNDRHCTATNKSAILWT